MMGSLPEAVGVQQAARADAQSRRVQAQVPELEQPAALPAALASRPKAAPPPSATFPPYRRRVQRLAA